jgi:DNA repair protein RecO (recombination protein O)
MPSFISDEGMILHQVRFGESDKFLKIFTKESGLSHFFAKGVRKLTSKKSPHLDTLNVIKFQTARGNSPFYLSQVESIYTFPEIKNDLFKARTALFICELLVNLLPENQKEPYLYLLSEQFFHNLEKTDNIRDLTTDFQLKLVEVLGFNKPKNESPSLLTFKDLMEKIRSRQIKIS